MNDASRLPPLFAEFLGVRADREPGTRPTDAARRRARFLRFPGTGGGWVLLDARNPAVFRAGVALLPQGRLVSRLASRVVGASSRFGLHTRLARARVELDALPAPCADLCERFGALPSGLACNAASGVPGRDQKTIVQLVAPEGRVVAFAKLADAPSARALVRRERTALERLLARGVDAPRVLGFQDDERSTTLVQEALAGERAPGRFGAVHAAFLARLDARTGVELAAAESPASREAHARLEGLAGRADRAWLETFARLARALAPNAYSERVACSFAHGDFTPWNTVVGAHGLRAFDWEHARETAPRGHDALHFVLQQAILVERVPTPALWAHVRDRLAPHADVLPPREFERALGAYLLDIALVDELRQLEHRSPFAQVDWLRDARLALAADWLRRAPRSEALP